MAKENGEVRSWTPVVVGSLFLLVCTCYAMAFLSMGATADAVSAALGNGRLRAGVTKAPVGSTVTRMSVVVADIIEIAGVADSVSGDSLMVYVARQRRQDATLSKLDTLVGFISSRTDWRFPVFIELRGTPRSRLVRHGVLVLDGGNAPIPVFVDPDKRIER